VAVCLWEGVLSRTAAVCLCKSWLHLSCWPCEYSLSLQVFFIVLKLFGTPAQARHAHIRVVAAPAPGTKAIHEAGVRGESLFPQGCGQQ
jgi:hypothetical protein